MGNYILSVDLGTTSVKTAIIDKTGVLLAASTQEYELLTPQASYVECNPETYWNAFITGYTNAKEKSGINPEEIAAIGISAQGETLFFLGENGKPLRDAIVWMDNRAEVEADELRECFTDEQCYKITGQVQFDPCWPASKILWVKKNQPEIFKKTYKFLLIEDWFIQRLTGEIVSEGSLLCSTCYWNITTKRWWGEMLDFLGISEEKLPKILEPGQKVANILPQVADQLGMNRSLMVCTGALDQAAGAIGVGNIKEGIFSENIGAALAVCVPVNKPLFDPKRVVPLHYFGLPDMYMLHTFTTGGMTIRWFRDTFCQNEMSVADISGDNAYKIMDNEAASVPPGSEGLVMLPHLAGSMAPDINSKARGVYFGFSLKHKKPHFIRAIMESIGYIILRNIEAIEDVGIKVTEIRSLGGGSRSNVWNQIKSDITGRELITVNCPEAACLGVAILAGKAVGMFDSIEQACRSMVNEKQRYTPDKGNESVYLKGYIIYKKLFADLTNLFNYIQ